MPTREAFVQYTRKMEAAKSARERRLPGKSYKLNQEANKQWTQDAKIKSFKMLFNNPNWTPGDKNEAAAFDVYKSALEVAVKNKRAWRRSLFPPKKDSKTIE